MADHIGCRNAGVADETFSTVFDERYDRALREAGIAAQRDLNINANSIDGVARDPLRAPWAIYPLHPIICARLIGDVAAFMVETSGPVLAQGLQASSGCGALAGLRNAERPRRQRRPRDQAVR